MLGVEVTPGPDHAVVVPFGGAEHDWASLELGAWIAAATGAPLKTLGATGDTEERSRVTRLLGDAGLPLFANLGIDSMEQRFGMQVVDTRQVGPDLRLLLRPKPAEAA